MLTVEEFSAQVIENIENVIVGKREAIELLIVAMLAEGHVLLEDVPGTGKTMLARSLAVSLGGEFKRVQCTPDLLPNDVTGVSVFNQKTGEFEYRNGPVFVNVLLADEINRATPRTQSALLEAMQERQVTVDGVTRPLPRPFIVLATQNPIEYEGTFPLPEAQLDRFLLRLAVGYPAMDEERSLLLRLKREHPIESLQPIDFQQVVVAEKWPNRGPLYGVEILPDLVRQVWDVYVDRTLDEYIVRLVGASRSHRDLALGGSPRASLALYKSAQAFAALQGRDHVLPEDIKYLAPFALKHRFILKPEAELRGRSARTIMSELLENTILDVGGLES